MGLVWAKSVTESLHSDRKTSYVSTRQWSNVRIRGTLNHLEILWINYPTRGHTHTKINSDIILIIPDIHTITIRINVLGCMRHQYLRSNALNCMCFNPNHILCWYIPTTCSPTSPHCAKILINYIPYNAYPHWINAIFPMQNILELSICGLYQWILA